MTLFMVYSIMSNFDKIFKDLKSINVIFKNELEYYIKREIHQPKHNLFNFKKVSFLKDCFLNYAYDPLERVMNGNSVPLEFYDLVVKYNNRKPETNEFLNDINDKFLKDLEKLSKDFSKLTKDFSLISFEDLQLIIKIEDYVFSDVLDFNNKVSYVNQFFEHNPKSFKDFKKDFDLLDVDSNFYILNIREDIVKKYINLHKMLELSSFFVEKSSFEISKYIDYYIDNVSHGYYLKNQNYISKERTLEQHFITDFMFDLLYINKNNLNKKDIDKTIIKTLMELDSFKNHINKVNFYKNIKEKE